VGRWALSPVKKPAEREADHSSPSSAEIKNAWSYTSTPTYVFVVLYLAKQKDNFKVFIVT
jgi:hypothetical protein